MQITTVNINSIKQLLLTTVNKHLRYYATFKVRKFESLFYKINTFLQKKLQLGLDCKEMKYSL